MPPPLQLSSAAVHLQRGARAEARVARWYQRRGWRLCAHNWHGGGSELDLVLSRWRTLLVVEVRYRSSGQPLASIDHSKLEHILRASAALIRTHKLERYRYRLDAVGISPAGFIVQKDLLRNAGRPISD